MNRIYKYSIFFLTTWLSFSSLGKEFRYLNRSPRALLMGDAFTAIADDEYTLFYNPAALGRHEGISVSFINPDVGVTNVLDEMDRFENFPSSDPVAISDRILGLPLYLRLAGTPSIKMSSFGLVMFGSATTNLVLRNAVHPSLDLDYRLDRGFSVGFAYSVGKGGSSNGRGRREKKKGKGHRTSFGVGVKNFNRQGISNNFDLFGMELLDKITSSDSGDYRAIRRSLGYSKGDAWGGDLGIEHSYNTSVTQINVGLSVLDVGDTVFRRTDGDAEIPKQKMSVNFGTALRQDFGLLGYSLAFDVHPINANMDFQRKLHFGAEIELLFLGVMAGWNGGYLSYGVSLDIWPISIYAGFYGVEIGGEYKQEEGKRALVYVNLINFSFDP